MSGIASAESGKATEGTPAFFRRWLRSPYFWAALVGLVSIPALRPLFRRVPTPPPVLLQLPSYSLVDQSGAAFGSQQLQGQVYLASFFFTRCPSICPRLIGAVRTLQDRYERYDQPVRLVSVSIDSEHDTPKVLADYAARFEADPKRWSFLTGSEPAIRALVTQGFKLHLGNPKPNADNLMDIAHSGGLALVDQQGRLRGIYATDDDGLDEAFHRSLHVLHEL